MGRDVQLLCQNRPVSGSLIQHIDEITVLKDIFEEKQETIAKYSVKLSKLQAKLISLIRDDTTENINSTLAHAEEQVKSIKKQFQDRVDKLDKIISDK